MTSTWKILASIIGVICVAAILAFTLKTSSAPVATVRTLTKVAPLSQAKNKVATADLRDTHDKLASMIALSQEFQTTRDLHGLYMRLRDTSNPDAKRVFASCESSYLPVVVDTRPDVRCQMV